MPFRFTLWLALAPILCAEQSLLDPAEWNALRNEISGDRAWQWANRIAAFDRNIGSEGYMDALRYVETELKRVGISKTRVVDLPSDQPSWTGVSGELWIKEPVDRKWGSFADAGTAVAINSRSADVTAELVDVGDGEDEEAYRGKSIEGKIVLSCGKLDRVFRLAVFRHGAAGVVTCAPRWPGPAFEFPDHIGWQTIPAAGENGREPTWAFSISLHSADEIREMLRAGRKVVAHVKIETRIKTPGRMQILIGTIPAAGVQNQAIVYSAHLDHQRGGANDDASGCGNLLEIARSIVTLTRQGKIRKPAREIQFWFAPEVFGEYAYFARFPEDRKKMLININQEMVGENQTKLGSSALFERAPWSQPTWLNDVLGHFVRHVFETNVGTINQHERFSDPLFAAGGSRDHFFAFLVPFFPTSDHEPFTFGPVGVPAVHFTSFPDYNLHSNQDTIYNVDATQLRRFALIAAATGYFTAAADKAAVPRLLNEVAAGSAELMARMAMILGRIPDRRAARWGLRTSTRYAADCVRSVARFDPDALVIERSAARVMDQGRILEAQMEDVAGKAADEPTPEESVAAGRVPYYAKPLGEIFSARKKAGAEGARLSGPMSFEVDSLVDGKRSCLEIFRIVHAESLFGGTVYYGSVSLGQVMARIEALARTGVLAYR